MVTAAPQDQWRLLDVQSHDTRLAQIAHRRSHLPEHAEVDRFAAERELTGKRMIAARTVAGDIAMELVKAETDVEQVRSRAVRNRMRLETGTGTAKDLQALQRELESLADRQTVLEDAQLEVMERAEAAQAQVADVEAALAKLDERGAEIVSRRDAALEQLADEELSERRAREAAAAGVPAELMALYEKVRASSSSAGIAAARIAQRRCEGCRLEMNNVELGRLRTAAPDAVVRCEECGRILIRTPESGL